MYLNVRGLKSKLESFIEKIMEVEPTVFCVTETRLHKDEEFDMESEGYAVYRNDRNNNGGGVLIGVKIELKNVCTIVEKKKDIEESIWVLINNSRIQLRIGCIYAPQESRTSKEVLEKMYDSIQEQIEIAKERQQNVLMVGDLNCKVGDVIQNNKTEITKGGRLLLKMVKENKMILLNASDRSEGLWTRVEGQSKSVLDYVIINEESEAAFEKMKIDEDKEFSPIGTGTHSDHNVMIAKFNWFIIEKERSAEKRKIITPKGYADIKEEMANSKIASILQNETESTQTVYGQWKKKVSDIVTRNSTTVKKRNPRKKIKLLVQTKKRLKKEAKKSADRKVAIFKIKMIDEQIKKERGNQFKNKIDKVVEKLRSKNGINGPRMWEVVKRVKRKKVEPATAIKSKDGKILEDPEAIKGRYLEHFQEILQPVVAESEEEKEQEKIIHLAFQNILSAANKQQTVKTTDEEIEMAIHELKKKKCKDAEGWVNEIVMYGGEEMFKSLKCFFNRIETERCTPKEWKEVLIKAISKPGSVLEMDNKRGLFITETVSKIYERVLKNRNNKSIIEYISEFQTGGTKGRATIDNTIILSEVIRKNRKLGRKTYIVFGDAVKCFDKLWLKDCLVELYNAGCNPQDIQMMYLMNQDTEVTVVTPSGATEKINVGEIVKQGTVLGPTLCCVVTDQVNCIGESQIGSIGRHKIGILVFVDDVMSAGVPENARRTIRSLNEMEIKKKVRYGLKKTNYMVIDTGKEADEVIDEKVKAGVVPETNKYRYVGVWVNKQGNLGLHLEMKGNDIKGEVAGLKSIANYYNVGGTFVNARLELYESCIIPSLLYNLEGWNQLSKNEVKKLEQIQGNLLCSLLHLPKTTPYIGLLNEVGVWKIEERLKYRKIMLYHNLQNSSDNRLSKKIVDDQKESEEDDTFYADVHKMAASLDIDMDSIHRLKKSQLKSLIKEQVGKKMVQMVNKARSMKKLRFVNSSEVYGRKRYIVDMDGQEALKTLKIRLNMMEIYGNFKGNVTLKRLCPHCEEEDDTTEHLISCEVFENNVFSPADLRNDSNKELWSRINELVDVNMANR